MRVGLRDKIGYREILLHEVWWADVNEPYSIAKQVRFWLWGLSIWSYPRKTDSDAPGFAAMIKPVIPRFDARRRLTVRLQLFAISTLFLMAAFPLGIGVVLAKRLLNLSPPDFIQTLVNYVSGVKLYNQRRRRGAALLSKSNNDFIDAMSEPPRISVRRRMIETIVDVALQNYSRWYVLAHSLGSVVAQNGLMEPAETLAHYLGKEKWELLKSKGGAGPNPREDGTRYFAIEESQLSLPRRPTWLSSSEVVYRDLVLSGFKGLLTYGSPLEKFAAIWPPRVAINRAEPHFAAGAEWINIYDPVDPVSGVLCAFNPQSLNNGCVPRLVNIGYRTDWKLLYAHLRYLNLTDSSGTDLGDAVAYWIANGREFRVPEKPRERWFKPYDRVHTARKWLSALEWLVVAFLIALLGAWCIGKAYSEFGETISSGMQRTFSGMPKTMEIFPPAAQAIARSCVDGVIGLLDTVQTYVAPSLGLIVVSLLIATFYWGFSELCEWQRLPRLLCTVPRWFAVIWLSIAVACFASVLIKWLWHPLALALEFTAVCAAITLFVGGVANMLFFRRDPDDPERYQIRRRPRHFQPFRPGTVEFGLPGAASARPHWLRWVVGHFRASR
ncbi:MAG: hypothetical protein QOF41_2478 [Methylobacteriaceae bacterium]|nr:hypothetical protein [Methylobacteriaceae bacterium]